MDNIAAISFTIDDSHKAWIYPSGTSDFEELKSETYGQLNLYYYQEKQRKEFFEYKESELNILNLRLKETIRYCCLVTNCDKEYYPIIRNQENKFVKLEKEKDRIIFQFINYLGKSSISFGDYGSLDFEVVADKINYEEDYINLTNAIADECAALLLDYTSPTNLTFDQNKEKQAETALEQFIFLRQFCYADNLESLFASIKRNPDRLLVKEDEIKPFGTGQVSQKFFTNPFSNARGWNNIGNGVYIPSEISVTHKYDSLDTPANRFLKFALNTFLEICKNIIQKVESSQTVYYSEANTIKNYLENILQDSFFDDVQELTIMPVNNQVLEKREGYAQIFNAFSMVDLALQLDWKGRDDVYSGEAKNTALLYEYWLFFELRKIIAGIEKCKPILNEDDNAFIKDIDGLTISLKQDKQSIQQFEIDKQKINLYYNRTFDAIKFANSKYKGSYSRPFRPDYSIAIFPKNFNTEEAAIKEGEVRYIHFDAKYRLEDLSQFINKEENPSEKEIEEEIINEKTDAVTNTYKRGDLLKMHTYNDAIRRTIGSYVLYPGTDNKKGKVFSVYEEILPGVGAFAIRPSDTNNAELNEGEQAVKDFIERCIEFNSNPAGRVARTGYFENMVIEAPSIDSEQLTENDDSDLTMIGFVKEDYNEFLKKYDYKTEKDGYFFFYFRAIEKGKVYTFHKETFQAKFLRFTTKKFIEKKVDDRKYKFEKLEPWIAEINSIKLVSQDVLAKTLKEYQSQTKHSFNAEYYYLVKAKIYSFGDEGITAISTEENNIISPYSPKIVQLTDGNTIYS